MPPNDAIPGSDIRSTDGSAGVSAAPGRDPDATIRDPQKTPAIVPAERDHTEQESKDLATNLAGLEFHPVVIIGTPASGKSILIISLILYAIEKFGARLLEGEGEDFFKDTLKVPAEIENEKSRARLFYRESLPKFRKGESPDATGSRNLFFVPISAKLGYGEKIDKKIAFMDAGGELFKSDGAYRFKSLDWKAKAVLEYFKGPKTVIFVAPSHFVIKDQQTQEADETLAYWIGNYSDTKPNKTSDNVLLALTKWDALFSDTEAKQEDGAFTKPTEDDVLKKIVEDFPQAWGAFKRLDIRPKRNDKQDKAGVQTKGKPKTAESEHDDNTHPLDSGKALLPHAAGFFVEEKTEIRKLDVERTLSHKEVFDRFDKSFWDWFGENLFAQEHESKSKSAYHEEVFDPQEYEILGTKRFVWNVLFNLKLPEKK